MNNDPRYLRLLKLLETLKMHPHSMIAYKQLQQSPPCILHMLILTDVSYESSI